MDTGRSAKVANLEQAPGAITWSPDGKTLAFVMLERAPTGPLGAPLTPPPGAKWAEPLRIIDRVTYRRDGGGYVKPGYRHLFVVSADGGQPRQVNWGKFDEGGQVAFTPDGKSLLYFASDRLPGWEREQAQESDIYCVSTADRRHDPAHHPQGPPDQRASTPSPDGSKIAYVGFDDHGHRGYENVRLYVMDRDGKNSHVPMHRRLRPQRGRGLRSGRRTARASTSTTPTTGSPRSPAPPWTAQDWRRSPAA